MRLVLARNLAAGPRFGRRARRLCLVCLALACVVLAAGIAAAEPPREAHGMADTFAAPGVALAWGVLRAGEGSGDATVVVRVVTDRKVYSHVAAVGIDPFTNAREPRLAATPVGDGGVDLRVPRARFADFPRTEFLLYDGAQAVEARAPKLVVFYVGVPDTTPEFATASALDAHLAERIRRLTAGTGSKSP